MNKRTTIKNLIKLSVWILVLSGIATLLVAANSRQKDHLCSEILIGIRGAGEKLYIDREDVLQIIEEATSGKILNRPVTRINLATLEKTLEKNSWVRDAELYFDSRDALHVQVEERQPIARVFATNGTSFYIDSSGHKMNLVEAMSERLPVITGYVYVKRMDREDSVFLDQVKEVTRFIYHNEFWNAQVGQIDITPEKNFELIPVIGDHVIRIGSGEDVAGKLNRLFVFYKQVIAKVGFNKYEALDVRFKGQVVAVKKGPTSPVDSIQLKKNIEELVNRAALQEVDDHMLPQRTNDNATKNDSAVSIMTASQSVSTKTDPHPTQNPARTNPPKKTTNPSKPIETPKQTQVRKNDVKKPKAVMQRQ